MFVFVVEMEKLETFTSSSMLYHLYIFDTESLFQLIVQLTAMKVVVLNKNYLVMHNMYILLDFLGFIFYIMQGQVVHVTSLAA